RKRIFGVAGRVAAISLGAIIFAAVLPCGGFAATQTAAKPSASGGASPKQIQELMTLLADPKVRNWLGKENKAEAASEQAASEESVSQELDGRLAAIREHIAPTRHRGMRKARLTVHHRSACSGVKALRNTSAARRQAAKLLCYRFGPLTPSARSANLIA